MKRDYGNIEKDFLLSNFNFQDKKILEIGSGDGYYTELFLSSAQRCVAIEPDSQKIVKAQKRLHKFKKKISFLCGRTESFLNILDNDFDVIIFSYSLHHHENPKKVFSNIINLLKNGAYVIVIEPVHAGEYCQFLSDFHDESVVLNKTNDVLEQLVVKDKKLTQIEVNWFFEDKNDIRNFLKEFSTHSDLINKKIELIAEGNIIFKDRVKIWTIYK